MNIAFVISETFSLDEFNGIRIQAETWAQALEAKGHKVVKINPWQRYLWNQFDIIHIIGPCEFILKFAADAYKLNSSIVFSPIIDTIQSKWKYKLASYWGIKNLRLSSYNHDVRMALKFIKQIYVRSKYEAEYVHYCYSQPYSKIEVVPLSYRLTPLNTMPSKQNFCLSVSILTQKRKNVMRLMQAAIKYNFNLVLAGSVEHDKFAPFKILIESTDNITYLGKVSDERLKTLYAEAKVFALPSINEGVGMVALDAAVYGCNIVITEKGGPKEYYGGMAYTVNPYDIDDIGGKIIHALCDKEMQPILMQYVQREFSLDTCIDKLICGYKKLHI